MRQEAGTRENVDVWPIAMEAMAKIDDDGPMAENGLRPKFDASWTHFLKLNGCIWAILAVFRHRARVTT